METDKRRIAWVDVAKGICMISVIAGHLGVAEINNVVFAFHLTVFFLLSGYTFKPTDPDKEFINKKFKSLMIPYFITCICIMCMDVFNSIWWDHGTSIKNIIGIISNDLVRSFMASGSAKTLGTVDIGSRIGAIWFLPALFFALIFTQIIMKYVANRVNRFIVGFSLMIIAFLSARFIWLPFSIQSAMFAVPFILAGYEMKQFDLPSKLNWRKCIGCLAIFLLCLGLGKSKINFVSASMDDLIISLISGASSSLVIIFCAMKLEKCKPLAWIGRHSLIFLCVHLFEMDTMGKWFRLILESLSIPYTEFPRFCIKIIFISMVTALILFMQKKVHFRTAIGLESNVDTHKANRINIGSGKRDASIDITRGILIVLMLVGYFPVEENFRNIIYSLYMVAFVFLSGYFFRPSDTENLPESILKLIKSFLIPYAVFAVLAILMGTKDVQTVLFGISYTENLFTGAASVGPVYFILMLFIVRLIYLFIEKYCPNEYWKTGICLVISLGGVWLGMKGYWLPWSLDCAMFSIVFYHIGYYFKKFNLLEYFKNNLISYFGLSVIWAYMVYKGGMELAVRNYGSYGLTILGAVSAVVLLYMLSCYINEKMPYWISNLARITGESTIYILIIHALFNGRIQEFVGGMFGEGYIYHMIVSIVLQVLIGILVYILIRAAKTILSTKKDNYYVSKQH